MSLDTPTQKGSSVMDENPQEKGIEKQILYTQNTLKKGGTHFWTDKEQKGDLFSGGLTQTPLDLGETKMPVEDPCSTYFFSAGQCTSAQDTGSYLSDCNTLLLCYMRWHSLINTC